VGDTWDHADTRALIETLHDEVVAVARAEGVELDRSASWKHAVATYLGTGQHFTSMASDIAGGRRTEIDAILGEVVRRGLARGVPVPSGTAVVALLRATQDIAAPPT
jgi:2-dehydropantoate 2-reductase